MSGHPFRFEKAAKLDNEERRALQPAGPLVEQIATWAPERILDVGVGTGYFALPLARALPRAGIVGVDAEPRMLELARERAEGAGLAERITLRQTPPDRLELEDAGFDLVLMANLYHELPERPGYLGEIRRVLRAGDSGIARPDEVLRIVRVRVDHRDVELVVARTFGIDIIDAEVFWI